MEKMKFITFWLAGICIAVFLFQMLIPGFTETFLLSSNAVSMPWQFVTAIFLHGSISHLIYNLMALLFFGLVLEGLIGTKRFLILFIGSGIVANLISFSFYPSSLGASGAIMAIIGVVAVLKPLMTVWAFNLPMPMFVLAIIWVAGSVMGIFGFGDSGVGHWAHLSGIVVGLIYGFYLRIKYNKRNSESEQVFERRIVFDENQMRRWEDSNLR